MPAVRLDRDASAIALAQEPVKVTIGTKKGDVVEGNFRGASQTDVSIEVAGQPLSIPLANVNYISFTGRLGSGSAPEGTSALTAGSQEDALKALDEIQAAVRIGILRAQYAEKLQQTLPRVLSYIDSKPSASADALISLRRAVDLYQRPLGAVA